MSLQVKNGLTTGCSRRCSAALRNAAEPECWADAPRRGMKGTHG